MAVQTWRAVGLTLGAERDADGVGKDVSTVEYARPSVVGELDYHEPIWGCAARRGRDGVQYFWGKGRDETGRNEDRARNASAHWKAD